LNRTAVLKPNCHRNFRSDRLGCLTGKEVSRNRHDTSLIRLAKEAVVALRWLRRRDAIAFAVQDDRRHRNRWPFRKFDLNVVESWITLRRLIAVWVGMDRNFDKIEAGRLR
jgi:hypothetical protein